MTDSEMRKFTPLGFETTPALFKRLAFSCRVNLPRWGLKRHAVRFRAARRRRKFTPLGFETAFRAPHSQRAPA